MTDSRIQKAPGGGRLVVDRIGKEGSEWVGRGRRMAKIEYCRKERMKRDLSAGIRDDRGDVRGSCAAEDRWGP